jgi:transcriptional regulator with XRE-family HTH domain
VRDPDKIRKLKDKDYRDAYMTSHVRAGIAYQIQALREQSGLTQAEFAAKIGKPQSVVSRLESTEYGKVSVQTLLDIACALDIALIVRFVPYPEFLDRVADVSPSALRVVSFADSIWAEARSNRPTVGSATKRRPHPRPSTARSKAQVRAALNNYQRAHAQQAITPEAITQVYESVLQNYKATD